MRVLTWATGPGIVDAAPEGATPGASAIALRRPDPGDRQGLDAMVGRCSLASRYGRFLGPLRRFPAGHLDAVTGPHPDVEAFVGVPRRGDTRAVLALGSLHLQDTECAEVALLVEDAWQRRGVGTRLLVRLAEQARLRDLTVLQATVLSEHTHVLRLLNSVFGPSQMVQEMGTTVVTVRLDRGWPQAAAVANTITLER